MSLIKRGHQGWYLNISENWRLWFGYNPYYWSLGLVTLVFGQLNNSCIRALCFGPLELQYWNINDA